MSCSTIKRISWALIGSLVALTGSTAFAQDTVVLSKVLQVCIRGVVGLTADPKQGIDAVEGQIAGRGGVIAFMISSNPNLPSAMKIKRGKNGYILPPLSDDISFIAESAGPLGLGSTGRPIGYGTERLYAFNKGALATPIGPIQDRIFVQLWSDGHHKNDSLVKTVGDALFRCH